VDKRLAYAGMTKAKFGRVLGISSVCWFYGQRRTTNYLQLKLDLEKGFKPVLGHGRKMISRITVTPVFAPGFIENNMTEGVVPERSTKAKLRRKSNQRLALVNQKKCFMRHVAFLGSVARRCLHHR